MSYSTYRELLGRVSENRLIQLTDDDKTGLVDDSKVAKADQAAQSEIDGYAATKYRIPFEEPIPPLINALHLDIKVYRLWQRRERIPDDVRKTYDDAVVKLKDLARGIITLGVDPAPAVSSKGSSGSTDGPARVFTRDKLDGF